VLGTVQGKGKCGIEFSIDSDGRLINRDFTYQSNNVSVNDAVYRMMMSMPKYDPPPPSYNGSKIKMTFYFDNGYYQIDFVN
jgi:hypothetical protein